MEARPSRADPRAIEEEPTPRVWIRQHGSPLLVLDCDQVRAQYHRLAAALPGVDIHYAVKALAHPAVLASLDAEGSSFDVSATGEIELLRSLGIASNRMVHTHPIKRDRDIRDALDLGCGIFVVDNPDEMAKFVPYRDQVSLLLRIGFRSPDAVVDLARKFGCAPEDAFGLFQLARTMTLSVRGLSFHVGSQCGSPASHVGAILECVSLMERLRDVGLAHVDILDIGGGFPAAYRAEIPPIEHFCAPIREALQQVSPQVRIIAEPGRFLAASAMVGVSSIVGRARRGGAIWYYLDDGVYGSFSGQVYDGARYPLKVISESSGDLHRSVLAGPTCDSVDIIAEELLLPELRIGDLIVAGSMGAYTLASASEFNSIPKTKVLVLNPP